MTNTSVLSSASVTSKNQSCGGTQAQTRRTEHPHGLGRHTPTCPSPTRVTCFAPSNHGARVNDRHQIRLRRIWRVTGMVVGGSAVCSMRFHGRLRSQHCTTSVRLIETRRPSWNTSRSCGARATAPTRLVALIAKSSAFAPTSIPPAAKDITCRGATKTFVARRRQAKAVERLLREIPQVASWIQARIQK